MPKISSFFNTIILKVLPYSVIFRYATLVRICDFTTWKPLLFPLILTRKFQNFSGRTDFFSFSRIRQVPSAKNSAAGMTDHIPVTPNAIGRRNTRTLLKTSPLIRQMNKAFPGFNTDWNQVLNNILNPMGRNDRK